mmetsp:Transcript_64832/g.163317  ORF Transcript_64832/g.163317 Transcript_64832/m.163317 type:complete len:201 (-) Transcript_64832:758-1360(-)
MSCFIFSAAESAASGLLPSPPAMRVPRVPRADPAESLALAWCCVRLPMKLIFSTPSDCPGESVLPSLPARLHVHWVLPALPALRAVDGWCRSLAVSFVSACGPAASLDESPEEGSCPKILAVRAWKDSPSLKPSSSVELHSPMSVLEAVSKASLVDIFSFCARSCSSMCSSSVMSRRCASCCVFISARCDSCIRTFMRRS